MDMKRLKKIYDKKKIIDVEIDINKTIDIVNKKEALKISILYYLENSGRYVEIKQFNNRTFKRYLKERYNMSYPPYKDLCYAFSNYEKDSLTFSPGVVIRVKKECGVKNIGKVLVKMMSIQSTQTNGISGQQIDDIIEANKLPSLKTPMAKIRHPNPTRADLMAEIERLNKIIAARDATIDGLRKGLAV